MTNVGGIDRILRALIGLAIIVWSLQAGNLWWILGAVILGTAVFKICLLYKLIGVSTEKSKGDSSL
ncbi:MAG: YgaP family membrane protein [Pseudomonadota bacterium]